MEKNKCDYCLNHNLVPVDSIPKLVGKYNRLWLKYKSNNAMKILGLLCNISFAFCDHIEENCPEIKEVLNPHTVDFPPKLTLIEEFLHTQDSYQSLFMKCNFCNKNCCNFHYTYGNYHNYNCKTCNKLVSMCGYCYDTKRVYEILDDVKMTDYCANCGIL